MNDKQTESSADCKQSTNRQQEANPPTPSIDPEVQAEIDEYEKNGACKSCQGLR